MKEAIAILMLCPLFAVMVYGGILNHRENRRRALLPADERRRLEDVEDAQAQTFSM